MDRSIGSDEREPELRGSERKPQDREIPQKEPRKEGPERRRIDYQVTDTELGAMAEIGRFRTVKLEDLTQFRYQGDAAQMRREISSLAAQGLVRKKTIWPGNDKEGLTVVTLTKTGKKYLERRGEQGSFYAGFVKPTEMAHDSAIYKMYQDEAERIAKRGGKIKGVALDYELKKRIYSLLSKEKPGTSEYKKRQEEIASEHGLKVIRGHIQLPDLRIEYQTRDGSVEHRDLELATTHYRGGSLSAKAEAGFAFYAASGDAGRLRAIFDDHDIMVEILNL